ncbi:ATP-binding cassette domain-containing protein [Chryseobacterium sp. 2TAF14]|uniref:ATP-binding cassette domain-containing protein n=1 Tax=Chryseobacterium sp. 2TAF14 TaxID=3233007 RepID=UPI003F9257FB
MALEVNYINYIKDGKNILNDINLLLDTGMYAVIGSNGAGKSTLLKVISTLLKPTQGSVLYEKKNIKNNSEYRSKLSYMPQNVGLIKDFDIVDNLHYFGLLKGCKNKELKAKISAIISDFDLEALKNVKVFNLSGGVVQRIGIALSLINSPQILLLDEPFNNLDSTERNRLYGILQEISKNSIVIISTHLITEIENIADQFIFMKEGSITFVGNRDESISNFSEKTNKIFPKANIDENMKEHFESGKTIFEMTSEYYTKYF